MYNKYINNNNKEMRKDMKNQKVALLKKMNQLILDMPDENIYIQWIAIVPDEATQDDFEYIASSPSLWREVFATFAELTADNELV